MPVGLYKRKAKLFICQMCGKENITYSNAAKFCNSCYQTKKKKDHQIKKRQREYKKRRELELKCQSCGRDLTDIRKARKYCPDCRKEAATMQRKEHYKKNREKCLRYSREYYKKPENKKRHRRHALKYFIWKKQMDLEK